MILTVTPNPALDMTWHVDHLRVGETHRVPAGAVRAGGKGLNVARVLHATGHAVCALTTSGGETGAEFLAELRTSGVPHDVVAVDAPTRRSLALVDRTTGDTTVVNEAGAAPVSADLWTRAAATDAGVVAISGSLPAGETPAALVACVGRLRAQGTAVVVDTSGPALLAAAEAGATVLKPNSEELRVATGEEDLHAGIRVLLRLGATAVLASLGEAGLLVVHRDGRSVTARFAETVHGNATGAGDAVTAAITVSLEQDPNLEAADALDVLARRAVAWGAAAVAMPLAGDVDPTIRARTADVIISTTEEAS